MIEPPSKRGFTLIELIVVISIMAILVGIILPLLAGAKAVARTAECLSNSRTVALVMQMYAQDDKQGFYPTAQMPMNAPFELSWVYLTQPYVESLLAYQCPSDLSTNWSKPMMPRRTSYGISAYFTPNHPPYNGIRADEVMQASETIIAAELIEQEMMDHFMPMYWGNPPAVMNMMMQNTQWDAATQLPKTIVHTRHLGNSNYVFVDGHASTEAFGETWQQVAGNVPARNWYDPK